jgi:hypothetical protein
MKKVLIVSSFVVLAIVVAYACSSSSNSQCGLGGYMCANGNAYNCGTNNQWVVTTCNLGTTCTLKTGSAQCEPLVPPDGGTGTCGIGGFMCKDNKAYNCVGGTWDIKDCSATLGQTCAMTNMGAACYPLTGPDGGTTECGMGGFKCEGTKAYNCGTDGKWVIVDCSATVGTMCVVSNEGASCEAI